jgi:hypothetical protein
MKPIFLAMCVLSFSMFLMNPSKDNLVLCMCVIVFSGLGMRKRQ